MSFQKLGLDESEFVETEAEIGFWISQFQKQSTETQRIFDWMFGVLLPIGCFMFDPIVFKGFRFSLMGTAKPFAYSLSFASIMSLIAFKLWSEKLKWFNGFLCGLFAVAGLISLLIGIVLLPFSIIGLLMILGLLGFTPLLTAFVYLRNAIRSYQYCKPFVEPKVLFNSIFLSAVLAVTMPLLLNFKINTELKNMQNGEADEIRAAANKLKYVAPIVNFGQLARKDCDAVNTEKNRAVAESYEMLTGESIERKNYIICNDF